MANFMQAIGSGATALNAYEDQRYRIQARQMELQQKAQALAQGQQQIDAYKRQLQAEAIDLLLFALLQELIFYKDAERLLLKLLEANIQEQNEGWVLTAVLGGEPIDPNRHELLVDIKAVTLHRFHVEPFKGGWKAFVILDV